MNKKTEQIYAKLAKALQKSGQRVFQLVELKRFVKTNIPLLGIKRDFSVIEFIQYTEAKKWLAAKTVKLPNDKELIRYSSKSATVYEAALSLRKHAYLCHYTAVFLHGLTDNIPKVVYSNTELMRGGNSGDLSQGNIDKAFSCNVRQSNQIAKYDGISIYLLNCKNVGQIGVKSIDFSGAKLRVTDLERTLIDITVRPNYAGGVHEVLNAYIAAKDTVSVNRLVATLKKLDYTYPYHQSIGFYMEKAGYADSLLKLLEKIEIKYKFYLTYKMEQTNYSERWRLFYPSSFDLSC